MMTRSIELDAELDKLARTLSCSVSDLADWQRVDDPAVVRRVAHATRRRLATSEAKRLRGVVGAAQKLPPKLVAGIAQRHFGPVLCAATLGSVHGGFAVKVSRHLSVPFMVEITEASEPESGAHLASHLPRTVVVSIARQLIERGADVTLAAFADQVDPEIIVDVLRDVPDHAAVVRIARFMEDRTRVDPIVRGLPDDHIEALIDAVSADGLWVEGLDLIGALGPDQHARLGRIAAGLGDDVLNAVVDIAAEHDLWRGLIGLVGHLDRATIARFATVEALTRASTWAALVRAAVRAEIVDDVLGFVADLTPDARRHIATAVEALEAGDRDALVDQVFAGEAWTSVVHLLEDLDPVDRVRVARSLLGDRDTRAQADIAEQLLMVERADIVTEVLGRLPAARRKAIEKRLEARHPGWRQAIA